MIYLKLFYEFLKAGLFAVGGGIATLPFLEDIADKTEWYTRAELANMIAISESTPGPIGINTATHVGFTTTGILGAVVSTIGLIIPSLFIILLISKSLEKFSNSSLIRAIFYGLRPASVALIATAGIGLFKLSILNIDLFKKTGLVLDLISLKGLILAVVLFFLVQRFNKHPLVYIAGSAIVGVIFKFAGS